MHGPWRVGWLWLRIGLAHLLSPWYVPPILVFAAIMVVLKVVTLSATWRQDLRPHPEPTTTPTSRPAPSRSATGGVTGAPTPDPVTRSPTGRPDERPDNPARPPSREPPGTVVTSPPPAPPSTPPTSASPSVPPTTTSPPPPVEPSVTPAVVTLGLGASPESGDVAGCENKTTVTFTGTIDVDQAVTVTFEWDPAPASTGRLSKTFSVPGRKTVSRHLVLGGKPGTVLSGTMKLTASAPGATPVVSTADYSLTCV
jgi:hypothetical protein